MKKILIIITTIFLISGCKNKDTIPEPSISVDNLISEKAKIVLNENLEGGNEISPFSIIRYTENISPAITYDNSSSDESKVIINLSNELNFEVKYYGSDETIEKVVLSNMKVEEKPIKGLLKLYAIIDGNNSDYLDKMRNREITKGYVYEEDMFGKKLSDGDMNLMFSSTIEEIEKTSYDEITKQSYKKVLENSNVKTEELKFKISFNIIIYTDRNIYALPMEYSNNNLNVYSDDLTKSVDFEKPLYFMLIKAR